MRAFLKRHVETIVVAFVVAAITAAAPAIAQTVTNADKVDGLDAVGCKASVQNRAGKLVAACPNGYLAPDLVKKAADASTLDGIDSSGFYRSGSTVHDSELLNGLAANQLNRVGYNFSSSSTTRVGKNGRVLSAEISAPTAGFLLIHASSDNYNPTTRDLLACEIMVDGTAVSSSRRWFVVNGVNSDDDCATDAVVPVTSAGNYSIGLDAVAVDSKKTAFGRTVIWALFVPFGATGTQP
jgi:hypothetical protein